MANFTCTFDILLIKIPLLPAGPAGPLSPGKDKEIDIK